MGRTSAFPVFAVLASMATLLGSCSRRSPSPAPSSPQAAHPSTSAPASPARHSIHEWGLFAVDVAAPDSAHVGTEVAGSARDTRVESHYGIGSGLGTYGGKPVVYVHLDEGTNEQRFDLRLRIPSSEFVERWPRGGELEPRARETYAGWQGVVATRGACSSPTPAPVPGDSAECNTVDHFCEAAEIPRYAGDGASCLSVGDATTELLFYRTAPLPASPLPLRMVSTERGLSIERVGDAHVDGPILFITSGDQGRTSRIVLLRESDFGHPLNLHDRPSMMPEGARATLVEEAMRRGLGAGEADAFADAWAPAYFGSCRRDGPEAAGLPPTAFLQASESLLYFVPEEVVDAMVPLESNPPAREVRRVFLARFVDGRHAIPIEATRAVAEERRSARGALAGASTIVPVIRLGTPAIEGALSRDVIRRALQRNLPQLRYCYEQGLQRDDDDLHGRLTLIFVVSASGSVATSSVEGSTLNAPRVESCIAAAARRWGYPQPSDGGVVRVRYPIELRIQR